MPRVGYTAQQRATGSRIPARIANLVQRVPDDDNTRLVDTIRRTIRVLGAQPSPASNTKSVASAARLVFERLQRAQIPVRWCEDVADAPLIAAGNGDVGIVTYLDDSHPDAADAIATPPSFDEGMVRGPAIERKAGVVSAISTLLAYPALSNDITLLIETDRHAGSHAIEAWLATEQPHLKAVYCEVVDVPLNAPVIVRALAGRLTVRIEIQSSRRHVESVYASVLPDVGFALANTLAGLKTADEEVRLPGFYDGILSPDENEFVALLEIAPEFTNWLLKVAEGERNLATSHMTLGIFCAPSVMIRDLRVVRSEPYLPASAHAIVEFHLMPGQSVQRIMDTLQTHVQDSPFATTITPIVSRAPCPASDSIQFPDGIATLPLAPGPSPASLFVERGVACAGYAVLGRRAMAGEQGIALDSIVNGVRFLLSLVEATSSEGTAH